MSHIVYVRAADGFGSEAVDLHQCRRFLLNDGQGGWFGDYCVYYHLIDGRWLKHHHDQDYDGWHELYSVEHPIQVAHDMLQNRYPLPKILEPLRPIAADFKRYAAWCRQCDAEYNGSLGKEGASPSETDSTPPTSSPIDGVSPGEPLAIDVSPPSAPASTDGADPDQGQRNRKAGYLGLIVDEDRFEVWREGQDGKVSFDRGKLAWAVFKLLFKKKDAYISYRDLLSIWTDYGREATPQENTVTAQVNKIKKQLQSINMTIENKYSFGWKLAALASRCSEQKVDRQRTKKFSRSKREIRPESDTRNFRVSTREFS